MVKCPMDTTSLTPSILFSQLRHNTHDYAYGHGKAIASSINIQLVFAIGFLEYYIGLDYCSSTITVTMVILLKLKTGLFVISPVTQNDEILFIYIYALF